MTEEFTFQATSAVAASGYDDQPVLDGKGTKSFEKNIISRLKNAICNKKDGEIDSFLRLHVLRCYRFT